MKKLLSKVKGLFVKIGGAIKSLLKKTDIDNKLFEKYVKEAIAHCKKETKAKATSKREKLDAIMDDLKKKTKGTPVYKELNDISVNIKSKIDKIKVDDLFKTIEREIINWYNNKF